MQSLRNSLQISRTMPRENIYATHTFDVSNLPALLTMIQEPNYVVPKAAVVRSSCKSQRMVRSSYRARHTKSNSRTSATTRKPTIMLGEIRLWTTGVQTSWAVDVVIFGCLRRSLPIAYMCLFLVPATRAEESCLVAAVVNSDDGYAHAELVEIKRRSCLNAILRGSYAAAWRKFAWRRKSMTVWQNHESFKQRS